MTDSALLSMAGVTLIRQGRVLVQNLKSSLGPHEVLVLQGPNGCGKTTLLKAIAGIHPLSGGAVTVSERISLELIGHRHALKEGATVEENLRFWAATHKKTMLLPAAINFFSLECYLMERVEDLSAGWQRRVALARLIFTEAKLWLLDEPYVNLDAEGQELLSGLIRTRTQSGGAIILSSHGTFMPKAESGIRLLNLVEFAPMMQVE
ncbi:MAG: heme ABC exporter ATP-binding protein CcmA [Rickettsiales bacterium]